MCSDVFSAGITIIALKLSVYVERKDIGKNIYPERSFYWGKKIYIYIQNTESNKTFSNSINSIQFQSNALLPRTMQTKEICRDPVTREILEFLKKRGGGGERWKKNIVPLHLLLLSL